MSTVHRVGAFAATLLIAGAVIARADQVLLFDNFESYQLGALDKNLSGGPNAAPNGSGNPWFGPLPPNARVVNAESPLSGDPSTITPTSGTQMLRGANSANDFDQNWINIAYRYNNGQPIAGNVRLDFEYYDPIGAGGTDLHDFGSIGYYDTVPTGTDHPDNGSLNTGVSNIQRLCLGAASAQDPGFDPNFYQARIVGADDGYVNGWFNTTAPRSIGWHHMRIDVGAPLGDGTNDINFFVDDMTTPVLSHNSILSYGYNELELNLNFGAQTAYYDDLSLTSTLAPTHIPGDTNGDGVVDLTDLNNVLNNFGVNATGNPGDDNGDGTVDLTDLNDVLNNFGSHAASALSSVPEPTTLSLCALGATSLLARRRR